jgi:ssDNA-binding Zn-finger/Zn-ribbon topoisomerase 1
MAKISLEKFTEEFNNLSNNEKIAIYNEYCLEHYNADKMLYEFDEEFFNMAFEGKEPIEICRATFFGKINSWSDEYIRFNAYGNLESLSKFDAAEEAEDYIDDIYEYEDVWEQYIESEEEDEDEEEDEETEGTYTCPKCGHVFKQGEYNFNYDTAKLDFVCPECDWEGTEEGVIYEEEE